MKLHRVLSIVLLATALALAPGCGTTSQERIDFVAAALSEGRSVAADLDVQITTLEADLAEAQAQLEGAEGETAETIRQFIASAGKKLAALQARRTDVIAALDDWNARLKDIQAGGEGNVGDEIALFGKGAQTVSTVVPGPWSPLVYLAGSGIVALGGLIAEHQRRKRKRADEAFAEVVSGVQKVLDKSDAAAAVIYKDMLASTQSEATQAKVAAVKAAATAA